MLVQNAITSIIDDNEDDGEDDDDNDDDDDDDDDDDQFFIKKTRVFIIAITLDCPKFEVNCFLCLCFSPCFD